MAHKFVITKSANGEYRAYFNYNKEKIFWTEGYSSKAGAQNAIFLHRFRERNRRFVGL